MMSVVSSYALFLDVEDVSRGGAWFLLLVYEMDSHEDVLGNLNNKKIHKNG